MSGEGEAKVKNKGTSLDGADLKMRKEQRAGRTLRAKGNMLWRASLLKKMYKYPAGRGRSASGNRNGPIGRMNRPINAGRHSLNAELIYEDTDRTSKPLLQPKCTRTLHLLTHMLVCALRRS